MGAQATRGVPQVPARAVLLDAFGTLVSMEPPAPRLRTELKTRGIEVDAAQAEAAFRAEIAFYLAHHLDGRDEASLGRLRDRCAGVVARELGLGDNAHAEVRAAMLAALRFSAQADAPEALRALRAGGARLVVVSNWDCSLPGVLADAGLAPLLDGVVSSAVVGAAKPRPEPFHAGVAAAGVHPDEAIHVGDSVEHDVEGARAAGILPVLVDREGSADAPGETVIRSLRELASLTFARQ